MQPLQNNGLQISVTFQKSLHKYNTGVYAASQINLFTILLYAP